MPSSQGDLCDLSLVHGVSGLSQGLRQIARDKEVFPVSATQALDARTGVERVTRVDDFLLEPTTYGLKVR